MKYKTIIELDARIERIISRTVKSYYTDWKNYDRPKYMVCKGSHRRQDKDLILIARTCGTYIVKTDDIRTGVIWANMVYNYYQTQEQADYYHINIDKLTIDKIEPASYRKECIQ